MIFKPWDIVVVPFPFVDKAASKSRPALVLSDEKFNKEGLVVLVMITTAFKSRHTFDIPIRNLKPTGLNVSSVIRWKVFSLDLPIIKNKIGSLSDTDQKKCIIAMNSIFPNWPMTTTPDVFSASLPKVPVRRNWNAGGKRREASPKQPEAIS